MRRIVKENYGFEKLYSQGLSIRTPLNIDYQLHAINSLRKGIEDYDRRHGWRGPITNSIKNKNWKQTLENFKLDPTLNWNFAEITNLDDLEIKFKIIDENKKKSNLVGTLKLNQIKWTIRKNRKISNTYNLGDIIFVKKINKNWKIKQYPKVNGGIVALDPFTGDVKALVGGFNFKSSEFNRVTQAKRQPGSAFKPIIYAAALRKWFCS